VAGSTIKIRTALRKGVLTVRALIRHPMEVGRTRDDGTRVAPHFIQRVTCTLGEEVVLDADWGGGIAKDPYLSFVIDGVDAGTSLRLAWEDNQGGRDEIVVTV
jgi:thiosulfate oxidation carrier complex protein SoxZ